MRMYPRDFGWRQTEIRTNPSCVKDPALGNHWLNAYHVKIIKVASIYSMNPILLPLF